MKLRMAGHQDQTYMIFLTLGIVILIIGGLFSWEAVKNEGHFDYLACAAILAVGLALVVMQFLFF